MDAAKLKKLLDELELKHESEQLEDDLVKFDITVDESEMLTALGFLFGTGEDSMLRLMLYIDELNADDPLMQLRQLMELNAELPLGAYCLDPVEDFIYASINVAGADLDSEVLSSSLEALILAMDMYDDELEGGDVVAQG